MATPSKSPGARLRAAVKEESPLQVVGAINANHALLAKRAGFKAIYLSGGGVAAGSLGLPDLGISKDTTERLAMFREKENLTIMLLSDVDKDVLTTWGAFGEKKLYGKVVEGVIRSTFVVDAEGRIELAQYNVKATGHVAKLRKDLGLEAA